MSHWGKNVSSEGRVLLFCFSWIFSIMDKLSIQSWLTINGWVNEWMNGRRTSTALLCIYTQLCSRFTELTVYATVRLSRLRFTYWDLISIIQWWWCCCCCWFFPKSTKLSTSISYIWDRLLFEFSAFRQFCLQHLGSDLITAWERTFKVQHSWGSGSDESKALGYFILLNVCLQPLVYFCDLRVVLLKDSVNSLMSVGVNHMDWSQGSQQRCPTINLVGSDMVKNRLPDFLRPVVRI